MISRFLVLALLLLPASAEAREASPGKVWTADPITMEVRKSSDDIDVYTDIPWHLGLTVLDTMQMVDGITFTGQWNRGLSDWMILSINGLQNNDATKSYWLYCVNGAPAGVGVSAYRLGPGAKIIWVYGADYPPKC